MAADAWVQVLAAARIAGGKETRNHRVFMDEVRRHAEALAGAGPTPTVRTLAQTAALAWVALRYAEAQLWHPDGLTIKQEAHALRRIDHAHRRYASALKALAMVKRLEPDTFVAEIRLRQARERERERGELLAMIDGRGRPALGAE